MPVRPRQDPLPGVPGRARFGRQAALSTGDRPAFTPGTLPLGWRTRVDPADVICHIDIPGEPIPKGRPVFSRASHDEYGNIRQGHAFTPTTTRRAEEDLRWVLIAGRRQPQPTVGRVGVLLFFRTCHGRADTDNLAKLVLDAGNGTLWADDQQVGELHVHLLRHCTTPGTDLLVWLTGRRAPGT